MNTNIFVQIVLVSINAFGLVLAWWILRGGNSKQLKLWFSLMTIFILLWANFSYFGSTARSVSTGLLFYRLNWAAVSLFLPSFFYFFVIYFLLKSHLASK